MVGLIGCGLSPAQADEPGGPDESAGARSLDTIAGHALPLQTRKPGTGVARPMPAWGTGYARCCPGRSLGRRVVLEGSRSRPMTNLDPPPTPERSALMARIRGQDTKPEMAVRRLLHGLGYRYRLHAGDLPGRPDIVFRSRRKVIFVHGCFWHQHEGCREATIPKVRTAYWQRKFQTNLERDKASLNALERMGWQAFVVWECETRILDALSERLTRFLGGRQPGSGTAAFRREEDSGGTRSTR